MRYVEFGKFSIIGINVSVVDNFISSMPQPKDDGEKRFVDSLLCSYFVSVVSAWNAEIGRFVVNTIITRLFAQNPILKCACNIIKISLTILYFLVTYPLDLVKTRLQIQGEMANKQDAKITRVSTTSQTDLIIIILSWA